MKQLLTFFGLAYLISWTTWLPLYGHIFGLTNLPVIPYEHAIGSLGPLIAAFLTTLIFLKKDGVKMLLSKCFQIKPLIYLVVALFTPFLLVLISVIAGHFINGTPVCIPGLFTSSEFPRFNLLSVLIYNLVFFGFGEEVGWRGFALPRLQSKLNALTASFVLTLFWALWHLPLFFYRSGFNTMNTAGILGWLFSLLTGSILLTWLYNSSKASILICAIFHSAIDIAFTVDDTDKNVVSYLGILITVWGILTILFYKPKNLAVKERVKMTAGSG